MRGGEEIDEATGLPIIGGYALMAEGEGYFRMPLWSHIIDELYTGGTPSGNEEHLLNSKTGLPVFDAILCLYPWEPYHHPRGTEWRSAELYDGTDIPHGSIDELLPILAEWEDRGFRILVHCQAGLNRSNLLMARHLMATRGMSGREAIDLIQRQRSPTALCNPYFHQHLLSFDE